MATSSAALRHPSLDSDDCSFYSGLSQMDLMEQAIEHSLAERQPTLEPTTETHHQHLQPQAPPAPSRMEGATRSTFITNAGQRLVAWQRYDGILVLPEPEEEVDPVLRAISTGNAKTLKALVKTNPNSFTQTNAEGWLPLHEAAYFDKSDCLEVLLNAYPWMINKCTLKEESALSLAAVRERVSCVRLLLEKGADPDIANRDRETPLYRACERDNCEIVKLLLQFGANPNKSCSQGWTALHESVCHNNLQILEMLVKARAKVGVSNIYGITPLFLAAQSGNVEALRFLITNGADVNSQACDGATALYEACKNGQEETVKLLLSQNADANIAAKGGLLPLHIAAQRGNDREKLMNYASFFCCSEQPDKIVSMLIPVTSKARVWRSGISPLHLAAERNKVEVIQTLIEAGFDVNATLSQEHSKMYEDRRSTPLYFSVYNNNMDATAVLLQAGANPNIDTFNPLLVALRQGCIQTVTLLVNHGANVNAYMPTHPTSFPATVMFSMKDLPLLKYLLDNGCDGLSCFQCEYGSNPHPPIKTSHNPRDELRYTSDFLPQTKVQFCEMISTLSFCHCVGPIIDVLLDYVGNVHLCCKLIEHLDRYDEWAAIKDKAVPPRPLMQLCRIKIRCEMDMERLKLLDTLPIPWRLIKFLRHECSGD